MFQMQYPYSPLGDKRVFLHPESMSGIRIPSSNDVETGSRGGHLEARDMNASSVTEIDRPHENDVLMGRGGKNNQHSGNEKLRQIAKVYCAQYNESSKKEKSSISRRLVEYMRDLEPPARFLKRDSVTGAWVDVGDDVAREKASQVLRDAVAILLESETTGTRPGTDTRSKMHSRTSSSSAPAHPLPNWDDHRHTVETTPMRSLATNQSTTPLPVAYAATSTRKRSQDFEYQESSSRRRTLHGSLLYFEDIHQSDSRAPNPVRRKSSDAVMGRHHPSLSMSSSARYSSHPHQSESSSFHGPRLQLHRRRSSATDVSSSVLLGDGHHVYSEFDLFNGQLLESDGEERAGP